MSDLRTPMESIGLQKSENRPYSLAPISAGAFPIGGRDAGSGCEL